jgi:hypothetical protein
MNDSDIRMDITKFMVPGLWGLSEITLTHLPTGLTATARCANQLKARAGARRVLQAKVDYYNETGRKLKLMATCPDHDPACEAQGCPEHPACMEGEHTYGQHHEPSQHVGPGPCRCDVYVVQS